MSNPLLTYRVLTDPDPLQASPSSGEASVATITIEVTNQTGGMIDCTSISFEFLPGGGAKELCQSVAGFGNTHPDGWGITRDGNVFTAKPDTIKKQKIGDGSLTFTLTNITINQQPGSTDMTITEITGPGRRVGKLVVTLTKFPLQFKVGDFKVDPPNITEGESTTLFWAGSANNTYEFQYQDIDDNDVTISHPKGERTEALPSKGSYTIENLPTSNDARTQYTFSLIVNKVVQPNQATLTVAPLRPKIDYFEGRLRDIKPGTRQLFVKWKATNTQSCSLTGEDTPRDATSDKHLIQMFQGDPASKTFILTAWDGNHRHSDERDLIISWRFEELTRMALGAPSDAATLKGILDRVMVAATREKVFVTGMDSDSVFYGRTLDATTLEPVDGWNSFSSFRCVGISSNKLYGVNNSEIIVSELKSTDGLSDMITLEQNIGAMLAFPPDYAFWVFYIPATQWNTSQKSHSVQFSTTPEWPIFGPYPLNIFVFSVVASPVEPLLYFGCDRSLRVMNVANNSLQWVGNPITLSHTPRAIVCSPDGEIIFLASDDNTLSAITADTFEPVGDPFDLGALPTGMAISPTGEHLYIACNDGTVRKVRALSIFHAVKIGHFTASAQTLYRTGPQVDVTFDWATTNAEQVTLNGEVVTGNSKTVSIQQTTTFTLAATGRNGPVTSDVTVVVKPVNLVVSRSDSASMATFTADAGTYSVKFVLHYIETYGAGYSNRTEEMTVVVTSAGDDQPLSAQAPLNESPERYCIGAEVTVTGLPCGPVSAGWGKGSI